MSWNIAFILLIQNIAGSLTWLLFQKRRRFFKLTEDIQLPYFLRSSTFRYTARYASALRCQLKSLPMQFLRSAFHLS